MGPVHSKGFSVVELLVVIAVAATIVAIGVPAITSQMSHLRLTRSVRDMTTELNAARMKAIARNTRFKVDFTLNPGVNPADTFNLSFYNTATAAWEDYSARTAGQVGGGINISSPGASFSTDFYPNGTATSTSICVENTAKDNDRMKITVTPTTGMINVTTGC